ncbi:MAG: dihydrofolate reductase family protein [Phascolarctobacterium sp.]|uniref:RibD family protein n=1 Tax=Phascolarctobacterium sp. TaxID=2049039 RepID=UPI0026DC8C61|nr:dihydrofolate reductase family protein [Phascolarctobacterium sp.]MDO4920451.1 dihydrofolate reductase family protein [Phascolarctobacterium sp.]
MNKPYIICHMMTAVDGRIDCAMTEKLAGVKEYYATLNALQVTATLSGKVTAQLEMALPGSFQSVNSEALDKKYFSKAVAAEHYEIVVDTKGSLLWDERGASRPLIVITGEQVSKEYLAYLNARKISWIACGKEKIDLAGAMEILRREFGVERLAIVGGGAINAGFLDAGLLDEISILLAPGIDGRKGMTAAFDGLPMDREPFALKLSKVTTYDDGAVWLRYLVSVK